MKLHPTAPRPASRRHAAPRALPRCARCAGVIGVYEPIFVLRPGGFPMLTSLAATPDADERGHLLHDYCLDVGPAEPNEPASA